MASPSLTEFMNDTVPEIWYSPDFKSVVEDHLIRLRERKSTAFPISIDEGFPHKGDLYSLFTTRNIPSKYHWIIMRINGFTSPYHYNGEAFDLIIPDDDFIDSIYDSYRTSYGN